MNKWPKWNLEYFYSQNITLVVEFSHGFHGSALHILFIFLNVN